MASGFYDNCAKNTSNKIEMIIHLLFFDKRELIVGVSKNLFLSKDFIKKGK